MLLGVPDMIGRFSGGCNVRRVAKTRFFDENRESFANSNSNRLETITSRSGTPNNIGFHRKSGKIGPEMAELGQKLTCVHVSRLYVVQFITYKPNLT